MFKYLDENYSSSQLIWGLLGNLSNITRTLEELYQYDILLHNKDFHKVMFQLDELNVSLSTLRHYACREKLCCMDRGDTRA